MSKNIIYTSDSSKDLIEILLYISKDSLSNAENFIFEITDKIRNLNNFSKLGKNINKNYYIYLINENYLVHYKIVENNIYILSVKHVKKL